MGLPQVIQDFNNFPLREEFSRKNVLLSSRFEEIAPEDYLYSVYGEKDELVVVLGSVKDKEGRIIERGTVIRVPTEELWKLTWRSNAYLPYADFYKNYYSSKTLKAVRAFVVDCDGVTSATLGKVIKYLWSSLPAQPTYIVNSGKGVHFIYQLDRPVEVKGLRWSINKLNEAIQNSYAELLEVDKHPVVHPYRFPGFTTKINTTATAFRVRGAYTFEELMKLFEIKPKKAEKSEKKGKQKGELLVLPNGRRAFFEWVLRRLFRNPPIPGRRQNSFFALGIVAYKCRREVPYEEALEAIPMIYEDMMRRNLHIGFRIEEAYEAFQKGYQPKYVRASWKYLCELLGWEYRPNKRNGRTKEEHIAYMNFMRQAKAVYRRKEIMPIVWQMLKDGLSLRKISSMLGIPRSTLSRWIKQEELEL